MLAPRKMAEVETGVLPQSTIKMNILSGGTVSKYSSLVSKPNQFSLTLYPLTLSNGSHQAISSILEGKSSFSWHAESRVFSISSVQLVIKLLYFPFLVRAATFR